ncbi:MAG: acyl-CoA dehydrogenase family protein [Gammaproteobacteria bacterium]|nr:acyl-CoA dehydrogenase family protein [Gammaproteobacteria bacterium]
MSAQDEFRAEARAWLEANCPASMRTPMPEEERVWGGRNAKFRHPDSKLWLERCAARGWTVPTWPKAYGGGGLDRDQALVLKEEMARLGCRPPLFSFGISMLGPVLLKYGTEAQKAEHLPKIARGEIRWCQGYSEPGAGSDLAALATRAEDRGDHWLVNGQKIWTSYANYADWIFCLVRTDTSTKQGGISFLLFDMASPGVETRPITLISGASVFCETFLTDVKVPKDNLVGRLNGGWEIAKELLQHERGMISDIGKSIGGMVPDVDVIARRYLGDADGRIGDAVLRDAVARHVMDDRAFQLTMRRAAQESEAGTANGGLSSMFKLYGTEQNKRKFELALKCVGSRALGWEGEGFDDDELMLCRTWLRSKGNSIEGGTSEVQLNVIAKRVLGLPD